MQTTTHRDARIRLAIVIENFPEAQPMTLSSLLRATYGIGVQKTTAILKLAQVSSMQKVCNLTPRQRTVILDYLNGE